MSFTSLGRFLDSGDAAKAIPAVSGRFDGNHLLVPMLASAAPARSDQLDVASTLARATGAALSVVGADAASESAPAAPGDVAGTTVDPPPDRPADSTPRPDGDVLHTLSVARDVLRAVRANDVDTLVLPGGSGSRRLTGLVERIAVHADCDVVVVNGEPGYEAVPSILLPVAGGPHSGLAADLARAVAADCEAWIDVLHVVDEDASASRRAAADELVDDVSRRIDRPETTTTWVLEADDVAATIADQSRCYGLTVVGAPTKPRLGELLFGSTNHSVRTNARSVVLSVRNGSHRPRGDD
jgi:nucleotide-binding universal stress UspA family protein